jgi:membrane protease YdiL (CAAX protease family)
MDIKKLITFILAAFLPMVGIGAAIHFSESFVQFLLSAVAMFIPVLAVIFTQVIFKEPVLRGVGLSFKINRWWVIGWLLIPVIALAIVGMTLLMPGAKWTPDNDTMKMALQAMPEGLGVWGFIGVTMLSGLLSGVTINAVFALGEEIAWRGFLLNMFSGKKFWKVALCTGIIWGLWHAPIILNGHNYPQHPVVGVFLMVVFCVLMTPILMYFRQKSGSVIVPAIMHGTFNAVAGLTLMIITPANDLLYGATGLAGMIVLLIVNLCLFLFDRFLSKE